MENRININGDWYVREEQPKEQKVYDIILSREIMIETDNVLVEGMVLEDMNDGSFDMAAIDISYKKRGFKDVWDNDEFLTSLYRREANAMNEVSNTDADTLEVVLIIIDRMAEMGWIKS